MLWSDAGLGYAYSIKNTIIKVETQQWMIILEYHWKLIYFLQES